MGEIGSQVNRGGTTRFDTIVVGLGAMGSACAFHLARRGQRVLGLDRFAPPHTMGSSHGHSRIIRKAYFEHPQYVPLVERAYALWHELEASSGERLLEPTGGLMIGAPESAVVAGALRSAEEHGLAHDMLSPRATRERFPAFHLPEGSVALHEPDAGILAPERCVAAHLAGARAHGATVHVGERVLGWEPAGDGVRVATASAQYEARSLVIAAGAWARELMAPHSRLPLTVERQVQHWFEPRGDRALLGADRFPIFIWEHAPGHTWYGFPLRAEGMKLAIHHGGEQADAESVRRDIDAAESDVVRALARRFIPDADGPLRASSVCLYTNTPDEDFIIDAHPALPQVTVVSPCSGHGFKFSSAIGEAVAERIVDGASRTDLTPFGFARLASPASGSSSASSSTSPSAS